ncbi:hypothetical protein QYM36_012496 [Artemia franciscana]|uniref:Sec16 Sec23-binding domain-containing protein n=1 Tax=Artemia franciscana TaxID=6661 RepID=A0AA88KXK9_ARTSF|nr:hypothetical protein QYM36_012496 [Artemia franciscana]
MSFASSSLVEEFIKNVNEDKGRVDTLKLCSLLATEFQDQEFYQDQELDILEEHHEIKKYRKSFTAFMKQGSTQIALDYAVEKGLWDLALILGITTGDIAKVKKKYFESWDDDHPLKTFFDRSGVNEKRILKNWHEHLAIILSNPQETGLDRTTITEIGKMLDKIGDTNGAHFCYLLSGTKLESNVIEECMTLINTSIDNLDGSYKRIFETKTSTYKNALFLIQRFKDEEKKTRINTGKEETNEKELQAKNTSYQSEPVQLNIRSEQSTEKCEGNITNSLVDVVALPITTLQSPMLSNNSFEPSKGLLGSDSKTNTTQKMNEATCQNQQKVTKFPLQNSAASKKLSWTENEAAQSNVQKEQLPVKYEGRIANSQVQNENLPSTTVQNPKLSVNSFGQFNGLLGSDMNESTCQYQQNSITQFNSLPSAINQNPKLSMNSVVKSKDFIESMSNTNKTQKMLTCQDQQTITKFSVQNRKSFTNSTWSQKKPAQLNSQSEQLIEKYGNSIQKMQSIPFDYQKHTQSHTMNNANLQFPLQDSLDRQPFLNPPDHLKDGRTVDNHSYIPILPVTATSTIVKTPKSLVKLSNKEITNQPSFHSQNKASLSRHQPHFYQQHHDYNIKPQIKQIPTQFYQTQPQQAYISQYPANNNLGGQLDYPETEPIKKSESFFGVVSKVRNFFSPQDRFY